MHGVRRILFFYVVPSTFFAFFGPQAIPADTRLEEVSRSLLSIVLRILSANTQSQCIHLEAALCDVACREKMRKLLRNSCCFLNLRQAALIDGSESSTRGSFRFMAGKSVVWHCVRLSSYNLSY